MEELKTLPTEHNREYGEMKTGLLNERRTLQALNHGVPADNLAGLRRAKNF
jgi:hypothetical protein